jgi:4-amino-4-deoxy-L-arabinose transferase-like glycosyltransferase
MMASPARDGLWLAAILLLALALRIAALNGPLWFDEVVTVETHLKLGWGEMLQCYSMNHHYLHNIAAKLTMDAFGSEPWAIRLPALIFGVASIAAMWTLARSIAGSLPAHLTALLMALSYHHIWFSTNARGYTGLALFSTLGLLCFLRGIDAPTRRTWLAFAACLAATTFTHLTGAFFFLTLGLVWLAVLGWRAIRGRSERAYAVEPLIGFGVGGLATLILYLPVLPGVFSTVSGVSETSAADPMKEYQNPLWTAHEAIRTGLGEAGPLVVLVGTAVLIFLLLGAIALRRRSALYAPIVLGHILLTVALLSAVGMRIWPRFFFTDIAFLLLLIVLGVQLACTFSARLVPIVPARAHFPAAIALLMLVSSGMAWRNYTAPKQDLAGAVAFVERIRQPGERVYATMHSAEIFTGHFGQDWATLWTDEDYAKALAEPGPALFVVTFPARAARTLTKLTADQDAGTLSELVYLPGTLGDGGIFVLRQN